MTLIQRPISVSENEGESLVAEIDWSYGEYPTILRGPLVCESTKGDCIGSMGVGMKASKFLRKRSRIGSYIRFHSELVYFLALFSDKRLKFPRSTRCFHGDDGSEYRWKTMKGGGSKVRR